MFAPSNAAFLALLLAIALPCPAAETGNPTAKAPNDKTPANVSVEDDPQTAMRKMRVTPGLKLELYAAEPLLENAVAFAFDNQGRCFVAETGRRRSSVFDIRSYRDWVDADLSFRTPQDRADFLKKNVSQENDYFMSALSRSKTGNFGDFNKDGRIDWKDLEVETDRIRLLYPSADGLRAERSVVFADGFNSLISGLGAGVAVHGRDVFYTCIPDVWRLPANAPESELPLRPGARNSEFAIRNLHTGFGVHIAYGGHDMHGVKMGPDGRLYWTIADRGFAPPPDIKGYGFTTAFLKRTLPDTGAVFRCDPDGANFEVVAVGLRNPQELAWDQFGNLFTVDNNADGGDKARVEYIVEGADYGWRYGWQHLPKLGAWNTEMLWGLKGSNTALYSLPPVAHVAHGPSGFAYYPGTGLPERFNDHFFVADFPGGVRYFRIIPDGAGFTVENPGDFLQDNKPDNMAGKLLWNLYPTDVDFPPGGGIAVLDWVYGWEKTGKGRIYRLHDPAMAMDVGAAETKLLLADGMGHRKQEDLARLMMNPDQRVRLNAQWEITLRIIQKGRVSSLIRDSERIQIPKPTAESEASSRQNLGLIHSMWSLAQCMRSAPAAHWKSMELDGNRISLHGFVAGFSSVQNPELRAQIANLVSAYPFEAYPRSIMTGLKDVSARVRFFTTQSLGKLRYDVAFPDLLKMLRDNADRDPYLRHAGVCALVNIGDTNAILTAARDGSASVRLAALLAMRRLEMPEVAQFLTDSDPRLVLEAARAINDAPIEAAMPQLASVLASVLASESAVGNLKSEIAGFAVRRAINANFRLGRIEHAQNLVAFAEKPGVPEDLRVDALAALGDWAEPSGRDRIVGLWRPLPKREARAASLPLRLALAGLLHKAPAAVRIAAIEAATKLGLSDAAPDYHALVADSSLDVSVRIAALRALATLKDARLNESLKLATADKSEALRKEASKFLGTGDAVSASEALAKTLERGTIGEQQTAYEALGNLKGKEADSVIRKALDALLEGKLRRELVLDVLAAAAKRTSPSVREKLTAYDAKRDPKDELAPWRETLYGGDAADGRKIFFERAEAGCFRCHKVGGEGGDVGPELAGLAAQKGRDYLLESILYPNKHIATGFESLNVTMKAGQDYAGLSKGEDAATLTLNSPEDGLLKLKKAEIARRSVGLSAMPDGIGALLTKEEIRNLVEFISSAKPPGR